MSESKIAPKMAAVHVSISKPGRIAAQIFSTAPFTTKVKSPSVKTLRGSVRKMSTGQMRMFARPIRSAAISADENPRSLNPRMTYAVTSRAVAEMIQCKRV